MPEPQLATRASPRISNRHKRLINLAIEAPTDRIEQLIATEHYIELLVRQGREDEIKQFMRECEIELIELIRRRPKKKCRALLRVAIPSFGAALLSGAFKFLTEHYNF